MKVQIISITTPEITSYIANFARVCTRRDEKETTAENDLELCERLWKQGHHTPFESIHLDFLVEEVSRSLLAQITRYRHMTFNVESQRYVKYDDINYIIPEAIDKTKNHMDIGSCYDIETVLDICQQAYNALIADRIKPEDARCVLPNATPTRFRVCMNLREFLHFYQQRTDAHAQEEIRSLAKLMFDKIVNIANNTKAECLLYFIKDSFKHTLKDFIKRLYQESDKADNPEYIFEILPEILKEYEEFI